MVFKRYASRYAHCNGFTFCTYSETGGQIITSGKDGDIRLWNGKDDDDASSNGISEFLYAVVQYDDRLLIATDMNQVVAYTYPDCKKEAVEFRFTAPPTCIKVTNDWIAAGAEDFAVKVMKRDKSADPIELQAHEGPIVCIDLSKNDLLVSKGGDGKLKVWKLDDQTVIHSVDNLDQCKTFETANTFGSVMFEPRTSKKLAYCDDRKVIVLETNTWSQIYSLSDSSLEGQLTVCAFSPDGSYLAVGTSVGEINVWNTASQKVIDGEVKGTERNAITSIAWNPDQQKFRGELSICDSSGQIDIVTGVIDIGVDGNKATTKDKVQNLAEKKKQSGRKRLVSDANEDDEGVNDIYNEYGFMDDEAGDDDDAEGSLTGGYDGNPPFMDDDSVSLDRLKNDTMNFNNNDNKPLMDDEYGSVKSRKSRSPSPAVRSVPLQPPFQPSSTPVSLEHRFMVWNHLGTVRSHKSDFGDAIEVEFHDTTFHHGIHIANTLNHTMASLSDTVLALACETPSKLVCITFKASGSREWSVAMPDTEEILSVCASSKLVAVATDTRLLRIFSVLGTQREVISIPGPVVATAAFQDQIIVAYHAGVTGTEDQNMNLMILDCFGYNIKCKEVRLPLTPNSKLTWLGISEAGSPVIYDSFGMLKLYRHKSGCWFPVWKGSDNVVGASDHFFIIHVEESLKEVHAVHCRGSSYPVTLPRPVMGVHKLELPLCDLDSEKTKSEMALLQSAILNIANAKQVIKENALKLFALACKSEQENRARELLEMLAMPEIVPLAAKYAGGLGRIHLVSKLGDMMPEIEQKEKEVREKLNEPEPEMVPQSSLTANSLLSTLNSASSHSGPLIAPAPMSKIKASTRNPFKKMSTTGSSALNIQKNSMFGHLAELAPNYTTPSTDTQNNDSLEASIERKLETKSEMKFIDWFTANKDQLKSEFPDLETKEFHFAAQKKFKEMKAKTEKRKLEDEQPVSGISKLAKFTSSS